MDSARPIKRTKISHNENVDLLSAADSDCDNSDIHSVLTSQAMTTEDIPMEDAEAFREDKKIMTPNLRSSGRQRRAPRKYSDEMAGIGYNNPISRTSTPRPISKASTPRPRGKVKILKGTGYMDSAPKVDSIELSRSLSSDMLASEEPHPSIVVASEETIHENDTAGMTHVVTLKATVSYGQLQNKKPIKTKSPNSHRRKRRSRQLDLDHELDDEELREISAEQKKPSASLTLDENPQSYVSRRKINRTDNTGNAQPTMGDDFEDAIRGGRRGSFSGEFRFAKEYRLAELKSPAKTLLPLPPGLTAIPSSSLSGFSRHEAIKQMVLEKLTGKRPIPLIGMDEEHEKVHTLVEQTVLAGEGNSMLLIGARGSGKSALVNAVIADLSKTNREYYHIIRLNGFIQTDDKLALREIWRQLGQEMDIDDDGPMKNYADTLSTLLALLSHSPDVVESDAHQVARSVIFIIDEFDLFAAHPRQTLLYNLFDIAQSRKAPIAVLGLTTRVDVVESLEKRVKSRFSHRYVHLGLPKSLSVFRQICKSTLQILPEELAASGQNPLSPTTNGAKEKGSRNTTESDDSCAAWNNSIDNFLASSDVSRFLSQVFHTSKSIPTALMAFHVPVALCTTIPLVLDPDSFKLDGILQAPDSKLSILPSLSSLALSLLIAAARLDIILDTDTCNFNMVYDEYSTLAGKVRLAASTTVTGVGIGGRVWGQEVARAAWERLVEVELLIPAVGSGSGMGAGDMVKCDVALEEIEGAVPDIDRTLEKWCREI